MNAMQLRCYAVQLDLYSPQHCVEASAGPFQVASTSEDGATLYTAKDVLLRDD